MLANIALPKAQLLSQRRAGMQLQGSRTETFLQPAGGHTCQTLAG